MIALFCLKIAPVTGAGGGFPQAGGQKVLTYMFGFAKLPLSER